MNNNSYLMIINPSCWNRLLSFTTYHWLGFGSRIGHWGGRWQVNGLDVRRQTYLCLIHWNGICSTFRSWLQILLKKCIDMKGMHTFFICFSPCHQCFPTSSLPTHTHTLKSCSQLLPVIMHFFVTSIVLFSGSDFRKQTLEKEVI